MHKPVVSGSGAFGVAVAVVAGLALWGFAPAAKAEFRYCNQTSFYLFTALGYEKNGRWRSDGWWSLRPGQCRIVLQEDLEQEVYYTYAEAHYAHTGGIRTWGGNETFCTKTGFFTIVDRAECDARGFDSRGFERVTVGDTGSWTTRFTEAENYTEARARIAGAQRLLNDVGYDVGPIDGFMGRRTRRALTTFKREQDIAGDGLIPDGLIDRLIQQAEERQNTTGFQFCNETADPVFAAVGYEEDEGEWVSRGWWEIEPSACAKPIKDALPATTIYTYAEARVPGEKPRFWKGERVFCTSDAVFTIRDQERCHEQGYNPLPFKAIDTGGAAGFKQRFTLEEASPADES